MQQRILVIDDDIDFCRLLMQLLKKNGYDAEAAYSGQKGLDAYKTGKFNAVICDYRLGDMEGLQLVAQLKQHDPFACIIVITAYSMIRTAVDIIKLGAYDYLVKPLIPDEVIKVVDKLFHNKNQKLNGAGMKEETIGSKKHLPAPQQTAYYKGVSPAIQMVYEQVNTVAATNYSVLLFGESGTGKEVIARTIHEQSQRADMPFIAIDCGTLSKELAASELFGHMKGSFTSALFDKEGHFEMANKGTLFLDEIGNLSLEVQASLLRVLQERKFKRIGGNKETPVDVRIIVASNENLKLAYHKGTFREDLYHRFNEFPIFLPPLRERKEDIIPLAEYFLALTLGETNRRVGGFSEEVKQIFLDYSWPGNLRECRNAIRRAVLLTGDDQLIKPYALPAEISGYIPVISSTSAENKFLFPVNKMPTNEDQLKSAVNKAEYETILNVMKQVNFNKKKAAELLNIDRKTLYNKLKLLHILEFPS